MHRWNASALTRPLFTDQDFTATKFSSAAEKAGFANTLLRFIETDFRPTLFTQRLYSRLSMCFGHIAHTNQLGFSETFFDDLQGKVAFSNRRSRGAATASPTTPIATSNTQFSRDCTHVASSRSIARDTRPRSRAASAPCSRGCSPSTTEFPPLRR